VKIRPLLAAGLFAVLLAFAGGWFWFRDSPLVAVQHVTVTGATGPDAAEIDSTLETAARGMSTLDVNADKLRAAVEQFPMVRNLQVSTGFPHTLRITVVEHQPVAVLTGQGQREIVAGDGTVLPDAPAARGLPTISVGALPSGRARDARTLAILAVLAAAPGPLLDHVQTAMANSTHGVVVRLRNGPSLFFGDAALEDAKWTAASDVLADPGSSGAGYIDLTDPRRPAAGAG
jgi:cell division protein FtsQ